MGRRRYERHPGGRGVVSQVLLAWSIQDDTSRFSHARMWSGGRLDFNGLPEC